MSNWSVAEWVGLYGAVLATALGFFQWVQWKRTQNLILIINSTMHFFGRAAAVTSNNEIAVTNRSNLEIYVYNCWVGYSLRRWSSPWYREIVEAHSLGEIDAEGMITGRDGGYINLQPGKRADFYFDRSKFESLSRPSWKVGFAPRKTISVDHSASARPTFMFDV